MVSWLGRSRPVIGSSSNNSPGLADQGLGDEHALALPAGQLAERPRHQICDLEPTGDVTDLLAVGPTDPPQQTAPAVAAHLQHFDDR